MRQVAIPIGFALFSLIAVPTFLVGAAWEASAERSPATSSTPLTFSSHEEASGSFATTRPLLPEVPADETATLLDDNAPVEANQAPPIASNPKTVTNEHRSTSRSPRDWYEMGGATMHVLVLCSVLILALVLERSFTLRRDAFVPKKLSDALRTAIAVGNRFEIKSLCDGDASALGKLSRIALEGPHARDRLGAEGSAVAHRAQRNLPFLAALGNLATMLGLLGTVLGMVEAFDVIAQSGTGDARIVAGGIFRALVTTAAGLTIAIFALAAHAVFSRRASDFVVALETLVTQIAEDVDRPNRPLGDSETVEIV